jgi:Cu/Ag efflux protein CusF
MRIAIAILSLSLSLAACGGARPPETTAASSEAPSTLGTIAEIRRNGAILVIDHEEIPGVMQAMTMPFQVALGARRNDLAEGDRVRFWIVERDGLFVIVRVDRV